MAGEVAAVVEFFFDCSSPWTWLGFHNMQRLASELHVQVDYRPVLLGAIFNAVNPGVYEFREKGSPAKKRYVEKDLQDWARDAGLEIHFPNKVFPLNSVKVMRGCIVAQECGRMLEFANAAFHAYWTDQIDLATTDGLTEVCRRARAAPETLLAGIERVDVKTQLRANTDELIERGGFGTPTVFIDRSDMYFGNDRLGLVRKALLRRHAAITT
jgi:2-hydroxychromene-2-carboxylate isomerase